MKWTLIILSSFIILSCSQKNKKIVAYDNSNYKKGRACRNSNSMDSAFYYYNLAKNDYLKSNDSIGVANSLVNMAVIQTDKGDYYGGIETSLEAKKFLKQETDSIVRSTSAGNYNNMAIASHFLKNYEDALHFYVKTLELSNDANNRYTYYNNIGDVLITLGKYERAEKYLEKATHSKDSNNYSKALNNLAKAKYLKNKDYNPLPEFYKALEIRISNNDYEGQNSSYETLSEFFLKKDTKLSLVFAEEMLKVAENNNSYTDQIIALRKIIELDPRNYLLNFKKFIFINSNIQSTRNKAKNQFAIIRYDVDQKNIENQTLRVQNFQQVIILLLLALIIIIGIFWYRKRKKRLQQEKELEVKNTQLKMSKKVHDVVANGIYQVMTKIENQEHFDRDKALDELEFVYEKSRDISYDQADEEQEFSKKISDLIASFNNTTVKTFTAGNNPAIWQPVAPAVKEEVHQMIRELMVNMKKHSEATHVALKFEKTDKTIEIQYKDNGIGISGDLIYKNGLRNTASRIESIGGTISFDTKIEKGLKVNLSFPVS